MKKSTIAVLVLLFMSFVGALLLLNVYKLELVHTIVLNAVVQKAPEDFSGEEIRRAFSRARQNAQKANREKRYLEKLLRISQRLEKIQELSADETRKLLDELLC